MIDIVTEDSSHRTWAAAIAAERGQWDEVKDDGSMREILYPDGEAAHTCIMVSLSYVIDPSIPPRSSPQ